LKKMTRIRKTASGLSMKEKGMKRGPEKKGTKQRHSEAMGRGVSSKMNHERENENSKKKKPMSESGGSNGTEVAGNG